MIALRLHDVRDLRLHDEPEPTAAPDEVLVRVSAVGLCGSDLHWFENGSIGDTAIERPLVLGHEFVGMVEEGPRAGERVVLDPAIACGRCQACLGGDEHLCVDCRFAGHGSTDGALRELMPWPERLAVDLPESLDDATATLLEPVGVALHALDLADTRAQTSAAVVGCGPLGLLLVQLLRLEGIDVVATDPLRHRAEAAGDRGASTALVTARADANDLPLVDVAFEVAGDDDALATAVDTVRPGGTVVLVGIPADDRHAFAASVARRKGLTLRLCRRMRPEHLARAVALTEEHDLDLASLVSERFPLARGPEAFEALRARRGLKVVVEPRAAA